MGIKRWKLYSDYGDSAMCETGNQPAGHWHPVSEDDYVLHADHAAEVARLEARVAELEWANGYASKVVGKLRAQLEAAKERCGEHVCEKGHWRISYDGDNPDCPLCEAREEVLLLRQQTAQLTAQPDGVAVPKSLDIVLSTMRLALNLAEAEGEKPVQMDFKSAETLYVAARLLQKTAAPAREDGVRERRLELALAEIEGRSNVTTGGHSTLAQRLEHIHALASQALAAAPAREDGVREAAVWLCSCVDKARRSGFGLEHEELLDLVEQVEEALSKEQAALAATKEGR